MLSHRYQDMQHQATSLEEIAKQTGLLINPQKTKTMRINTTQTDKLTIRDTERRTYFTFELKSLSLVLVLKVVLLQTSLSMAKVC
jgi:predicted polyphosphate/ATP-dependent NAD kinase